MKFYSSSISSLQDFKDYVKAKGYEAKQFDVIGDGYYAYFIKGDEPLKPNGIGKLN